MKLVSPHEAHALMEEGRYAYLDVRSSQEFEGGHPAHAFNVPWLELGAAGMVANPSFIEQVRVCFSSDSKLIVGCQAGTRSAQAAQAMLAAGFGEVVVQRAGMDGLRDAFGRTREPGWRASGLPVALDAEPGRSHLEIAAKLRASKE